MTQKEFYEKNLKKVDGINTRRFMTLTMPKWLKHTNEFKNLKQKFCYDFLTTNCVKNGYSTPVTSVLNAICKEWGKVFKPSDMVTASDLNVAIAYFYTHYPYHQFIVSNDRAGNTLLRCVPKIKGFYDKKEKSKKSEKSEKTEKTDFSDTSKLLDTILSNLPNLTQSELATLADAVHKRQQLAG